MTKLLIHVPGAGGGATSHSKFGGQPSAPAGILEWPVCKSCDGNMQFLGQLHQDESSELFLLFMCQNDPGCCDEWDADAGGNKVIIVAAQDLQLVQPPSQGEVVRPTRYGAKAVEIDEHDYDAARAAWAAGNGVSPREVLGKLDGEPSWIQGDETPDCDDCAKPMRFVAQLEQGPDWETEMNFGGGGCAYVFQCTCGTKKSQMLWQC